MAFSPETYALLLKKIEEGGGGGSGLPSVTAADNGKVLSVVSGAWAAANKSGLVIDNDGVLNKSYNELRAMFNSGIIPCFVVVDGFITRLYQCNKLISDDGEYSAMFSWFNAEDPTDNGIYYFISSDRDDPMVVD